MSTRLERRVVAKTANYTINPAIDRPGTVFTNRGATAGITFTLPAPGAGVRGWWFEFRVVADFNVAVATLANDTLITFNDVQADSVSVSTAGQKIGAALDAFCDGTSWFVNGSAVGVTYTVAS